MAKQLLLTILLTVNLMICANPCEEKYKSSNYLVLEKLLKKSLAEDKIVTDGNIALRATKYGLDIYEDIRILNGEIPDNLNNGFKTSFTLNAGTLIFNANLKKANLRTTFLKGKDAFRLAIKYFGKRIITINTLWSYGDNLKKLNELTKNINPDFKISDIAKQTWSGQQAVKYGFSNVYKVELIGQPGNYSYASFDFYRN